MMRRVAFALTILALASCSGTAAGCDPVVNDGSETGTFRIQDEPVLFL